MLDDKVKKRYRQKRVGRLCPVHDYLCEGKGRDILFCLDINYFDFVAATYNFRQILKGDIFALVCIVESSVWIFFDLYGIAHYIFPWSILMVMIINQYISKWIVSTGN